MRSLKHLLDNNRAWAERLRAQDAEFFVKLDECDIEPPASEGGAGEGGAAPCTAEWQAQIRCLIDCQPLVTCGVLNGTDDAGLTAWADCLTPCAE